MKESTALVEIQAAKADVIDAEDDLAKLMSEIESAARAEKTTISEGLQKAFHKLRAAREHLDALEKLAQGKDD
jgi:hypothetical protein